ncbi:RcpC/CpaB family pilus assembly protein [Streptomyces sp. NPDC029526]|uniref:RcpC/CpaB family pilus assembly protein n=1 Tax=Streptomyces sp. NPDC029526 TaxID=3155728 RepID=UPI0033EAE508
MFATSSPAGPYPPSGPPPSPPRPLPAAPPTAPAPPAAPASPAASAGPFGPSAVPASPPPRAGAPVRHTRGLNRPAEAEVPPTCEVPHFAPVRVRAGVLNAGRLTAHRRRAVAAGLAVTAAALVAAGPREADRSRGHSDASGTARPAAAAKARDTVRKRGAATYVTAPVRIADAATVRLLRPGDRVDVIAADERATGGATGGAARVVARGARVTDVPGPPDDAGDAGARTGGPTPADEAVVGDGMHGGALVVLSVPRATAAELVGASATARLAVALC